MNLFILTEEKPKISVIRSVLELYSKTFDKSVRFGNDIFIEPDIDDNIFNFRYFFRDVDVEGIDNIEIHIVSGSSSFTDFLVFEQETPPVEGESNNNLLFAIEETKTNDDESRNTGVYQRATKFVFIKNYYDVPLFMLYNEDLGLRENKEPSQTNIFGTNMLLTLNVQILGKPHSEWFKAFDSIDEVIEFKKNMKKPPRGNVPIEIQKLEDTIYISGRLSKPKDQGNIQHDPNIGALSLISATLRQLGWDKEIVITKHGVSQAYLNKNRKRNKFINICKLLDLKLEGLSMPDRSEPIENYWHYEKKSEKVASILLHILYENKGYKEVYQNHAGCERGYFKPKNGDLLTLPKKAPSGENLYIPDIILRNDETNKILLIEGKKYDTLEEGLEQLEHYDDIINLYIQKYFENYEFQKALSIFGSNKTHLPHEKVIFYLNNNGLIIE